jgi:hypothetical protein
VYYTLKSNRNEIMSWTDALTLHHDHPFIPPHRTYAPFTSSPQITSLHFTSLHCIYGWFYPHLHFALFITFLALFLKLLDLSEGVPEASAGSWFQSWIFKNVFIFFYFNTPLQPPQTAFKQVIAYFYVLIALLCKTWHNISQISLDNLYY